jgi:eukaryotic-like serine/threonine-protein kinase
MARPVVPSERASVKSAPHNTEEARSLLQARIAQFGWLGMVFGLVFLAVVSVVAVLVPLAGWNKSIWGQIGMSLVGTVAWLTMRRGRYRTETLYLVDAAATLATCAVFIVLALTLPAWIRPDLLAVVCTTDILVLRSFLVPSTTRRTLSLATVVAVAVATSTFFMYQGPKVHPDAPGPSGYVVAVSVLMLGTVILVALTSRTIFGLRERVREAAMLGQYTLLEKIGEGGMGIVFKARHAMLRRPTAIKLLPPERGGEHNLARFEREVQLTSLLVHPNTVSVYDYGRTADGILYYAMEYLDGIDLEGLVDLDGPQPQGRVIHLLRQIAGALEEAHSIGLIHRDVKPANVFLTARSGSSDLVKVLDFGLVKSLDGAAETTATAVNQIVGTPLYMAPESISQPDAVDARSDLYALGAVGYFLLTGRPPFTGATAVEVCAHHLHTAPTPPHERLGTVGPTALERIVVRCLEKSREQRPESAAAIVRLLDACSDVPVWTADAARDWWQRRAAALHERREERLRVISSVHTDRAVAVDLRIRARPAARGHADAGRD